MSDGRRYDLPYLMTCLVAAMLCIDSRLFVCPSDYIHDVNFGGDRSQLRAGQATHIMAAFHNLFITLIHRHGSTQIAATKRHFAFHPCEAFDFFLSTKRPSNNSQTLLFILT
jgi:hypothetical protein